MSQVAGRTLDLLEQIASSPQPLRLMELAERTGIDKSTALRLLAFLEERMLIRREPETRRYVVGPGLLSLSAVALRSSNLPEYAAPHLAALRDETGETVSFHLRVGRQRVCVGGAESRHDVRRVLALGEQVPLCLGPSGWVMLAFLPEAEIRDCLEHEACRGVEHVEERLAEIREHGCISTIGARTAGIGALAFPIFGTGGTAIAAMTLAGPADRWNREAMEAAEPAARAVAEHLSSAALTGVAA